MTVDPRQHRHDVGDIIWDTEDNGVARYAVCRVCEQEWILTEKNGWNPQKGIAGNRYRPRGKGKK